MGYELKNLSNGKMIYFSLSIAQRLIELDILEQLEGEKNNESTM